MIRYLMQGFISIVFNEFTRKFIKRFGTFKNLFYSYYLSPEFKEIQGGYMFEFPVFLKGGKYIEIGKNFSAQSGFRIEAWDKYHEQIYKPKIIIGDNVTFNFDCHIGAINKIKIGNNVLVGSRVLITDHNHGKMSKDELTKLTYLRPLYSKGPVIIHDNVWIGEGVAILPGVQIGENVVVGANSVVNCDIPDNCIIGGIPARIIKQL